MVAASASERSRDLWAVVMVCVAALLLAITPAALWMRNIVFDTEAWVQTVGPLADNPDIQNAIAKTASDALITRLDAQARIEELLPDLFGLDRIAPMLASSIEDAIRAQAANVVRSEQFGEIWRDINRTSHRAVIAAITGSSSDVATMEAGTLTLDTGALVDQVKKRLAERGMGFIADVPTTQLDRQVVLMRSDALAVAGRWAQGVNALAYVIPVLGVLLLVAGAYFALNRQRAAVAFGVALTAFGLLPVQALYLAQYSAVRSVEQLASIPAPAAQAAFDIIFHDLIVADRAVTLLGIAVLVGAMIAGPSRWAATVRGLLAESLGLARGDDSVREYRVWVREHASGLRLSGFALAALALVTLPATRTPSGALVVVGAVAVWAGLVAVAGTRDHGAADSDDSAV